MVHRVGTRMEGTEIMNHRTTFAIPVLLVGLLVAFAWVQEGWKTPPAMAHEAEGRAECLVCHQTGGEKPVPESHAELKSDVCLRSLTSLRVVTTASCVTRRAE
jgi:hypothetical protein